MSTSPALPPGARLLHIGPHKTGTTALQSAFHQARPTLGEQGVRYLSKSQHDGRAARYVTERLVAGRDPAKAEQAWQRIVANLTAESSERRVFSSEFLSDATDAQIDRVIQEIGADDLWIAITMRPIARILPSQYQQSLQRGSTRAYDPWLHHMLADDVTDPEAVLLWRRHGNDELVRRWADRVGADKVVVIVANSQDHAFLPRSFEDLLGLRPGTLVDQKARENRSLTADEAELLRRFNAEFEALGMDAAHYARVLRHLRRHLQDRTPSAGEQPLVTPDWATEKANQIAATMADRIRASGAQVLGDLDSFSAAPLSGVATTREPPTAVGLDLAAWFAAGLAQSADQLAGSSVPVTRTGAAEGATPEKRQRARFSRRG